MILDKGRRRAVHIDRQWYPCWRPSKLRCRSDAAITNTRTTWLLVHVVSGGRASLELNSV